MLFFSIVTGKTFERMGRPMDQDVVTDYQQLGLRIGRLLPGYVDCWIGDPQLAARVAAEPAPDPARLAEHARGLADSVPGADLEPARCRFLQAQLGAMALAAARLAGVQLPFRAEVEQYFDVAVRPRDPGWYQRRHDDLDDVLPGSGQLRDRLTAYRDSVRVPAELLHPAVVAVAEALRSRLREPLRLPPAETVQYAVVRDRPWNAFNEYLGGFRSRITLNADAGHWATGLVIGATHEAYPGHHAEHCLKEQGLLDRRGHGEHAIALVNTPQALVAEGTAELGLTAALGPGWGRWAQDVLRPVGLHFDGARAERVDTLMWQLTEARQDAAVLLHEHQREPAAVLEFLEHWMLIDRASARQALKFMSDPLWRAYTTTYVEGRRLVADWLAARPAGQSALERHHRLLTESLLPADLRQEIEGREIEGQEIETAQAGPTARSSSAVDDSR
jgi:hypothetical protein